MTGSDPTAERIACLERANRRLSAAVLALAVCAAGVCTIGAGRDPAGCLEARRITLRDEAGRVRARFSADGDGPRLSFFDRRGAERLSLRCPDDGASVFKLGNGGRDRLTHRSIVLRAAPDGWSSLLFCDDNERERLTLGLAYDGEPRLRMSTREGRSRIGLGADMSGRADLVIHDTSGDERAVMRVAPGGAPNLILYDGHGARLFSAHQ